MSQRASIPIIGLAGNLVVSIQVDLTDSMIARLRKEICAAIALRSPRGLVLDVSGVGVLDSHTSRSICDLAQAAGLMGIPTVLCGLQPAVAMTLAEMGIDLGNVVSALNLEAALRLLGTRQGPHRRGKATLARPVR